MQQLLSHVRHLMELTSVQSGLPAERVLMWCFSIVATCASACPWSVLICSALLYVPCAGMRYFSS